MCLKIKTYPKTCPVYYNNNSQFLNIWVNKGRFFPLISFEGKSEQLLSVKSVLQRRGERTKNGLEPPFFKMTCQSVCTFVLKVQRGRIDSSLLSALVSWLLDRWIVGNIYNGLFHLIDTFCESWALLLYVHTVTVVGSKPF